LSSWGWYFKEQEEILDLSGCVISFIDISSPQIADSGIYGRLALEFRNIFC
jgi:hypothetical protein